MQERTVRELAGEIWAEITQHYLRTNRQIDVGDLQIVTDIVLRVLARHVNCVIKNDKDLPVATDDK
jgi:hypothetical protein